MGELDKLEAFAIGRTEPLSADDVSAVLGRALGQPIYLMSDALGERKPAVVLAQLEKLLDDGEPALKLLGALHRALRQVRAARAMNAARVPPPRDRGPAAAAAGGLQGRTRCWPRRASGPTTSCRRRWSRWTARTGGSRTAGTRGRRCRWRWRRRAEEPDPAIRPGARPSR